MNDDISYEVTKIKMVHILTGKFFEVRRVYARSISNRIKGHATRVIKGVVVPGIPGLRAVPDLVPIHPILPPTVHIQPYHD